MLKKLFSQLSSSRHREQAVGAGACLIQSKGQDRKVNEECLLIKVTGLTPESISDIAEASVKAVKAANQE